ncbi:MAG: DsbA family protein [Proteobacteria bacterium]|nr:DsbA family protein [Pseudomonadota bacterium]
MEQLLKDYGNDLKIVYKHYVVHPQTATLPAQASCAAHKQGKFLEMEKLIWEKGYDAGRNFSQDNLDKMATELALNMDKFKADMKGECTQIVRKDQRELAQVGARGTPAFFINGRFLSGARPIDHFKKIIDEELKKANERVEKGTPVEKYYDEWVLKKGLKKLEPQK